MDQEKIARINALAHKAKTIGLSQAEIEERASLRAEYLAAIRQNLRGQLDSIVIQEADGTRHKLNKK